MTVFIVFEFQISMQSVYAAFEGTAMRQCREYNSDFSWVVFYSSIGSVIGPFLASVTIEDAVEGSGGKILRISLFQSGFLALFWLMGSSSMSKIIFFGYNVF